MNTQTHGTYFAIDGNNITICKLQGFPMGKDWGMGISLMGDDNYINFQVSPAPVLVDILNIIEQDVVEGNYEQIHMVAVSNRIAVRLFLEGELQHRHFKRAREGEQNGVPFIYLPECNLGKYVLPLGIIPETVVGIGMIATLDFKYRIVGDEESESYALPAHQSLIEIEVEEVN